MTPVLSVTPPGRSRIAMLSVHTCPLAALGGKETGGMNVYVRELARSLGRLGFEIDVFTRSQDPAIPEVVRLGAGARVIHVSAGPARPIARAAVADHLEEFAERVQAFRTAERVRYDLVHSHYWLSGLAGQASDIDIHAKEILRMRERLSEILAQHTGQSLERVQDDTDRDYIMSAGQAKEYGIIDDVLIRRA